MGPLCSPVERDNPHVFCGIPQAWQTFPPIVGLKDPKRIQSTLVFRDGLNQARHVFCAVSLPIFQVMGPLCSSPEQDNPRALDGISQACVHGRSQRQTNASEALERHRK